MKSKPFIRLGLFIILIIDKISFAPELQVESGIKDRN